ncbi:MAG TPA: hypothetical protein VGG19_20850 [Tepidisphaeraceae bacterium]|jgi:hypothetical protein
MKDNPKQPLPYAPTEKSGKDPDFIRNQIGAAFTSVIYVLKAICRFLYELRFWQ